MAAMAERLYCADFSRTGQDKYSQKESKVFLKKQFKIQLTIIPNKLGINYRFLI